MQLTPNEQLIFDNFCKTAKVKDGVLLEYKGKDIIVTLPKGITKISKTAFPNNRTLECLIMNDSIVELEKYCLSSCYSLKKVIFSDNITNMNESILDAVGKILYIKLPANLQSYDLSVFTDFSGYLAELYFPASVSTIKCTASTNVRSFKVDKNNKNYSSKDGVLYDKNMKTLLKYPAGNVNTTLTIPEGVEVIESWAFESCKNLKTIHFPSTLKKIKLNALGKAFTNSKLDSETKSILYSKYNISI